MNNKNGMSGIDEVATLLRAKRGAILLQTYEEGRIQEDLKEIAIKKGYQIYGYTATSGLTDVITNEVKVKNLDPIKVIDAIMEQTEETIYILKDYHDLWTNVTVKRKLRDLLEQSAHVYKPVILIAPQASLPSELEKLITVVNYNLPSRERVIELLEGIEGFLDSKGLTYPSGREREAIIHSLLGMTESEISNVLKKSVVTNNTVVLSQIVAEKEQIIRKTGLLEYITDIGDMSNVGGMDVFKEWIDDAYFAFDPEARRYNVDPVRGVVMSGFPGTGKSAGAKSVAHKWNLPLLKMNMSDIMDSKVGQSEKNIARALRLAEEVSPCVLWMDEFEKGLSGISSSDRSDSGTLSRVVQEILTWLSEKISPVFVIATANDVTKLPPELTRAGRFDEIMFVSLPHEKERAEILAIHLRKRGYTATDELITRQEQLPLSDIQRIANNMTDFTGAEIEQCVSEAGRRAYASFRKGNRGDHFITIKDIEDQAAKVVPLAKRNPALINELRAWAKESAVCASSEEHNYIHSTPSKEAPKSNHLRILPELID